MFMPVKPRFKSKMAAASFKSPLEQHAAVNDLTKFDFVFLGVFMIKFETRLKITVIFMVNVN